MAAGITPPPPPAAALAPAAATGTLRLRLTLGLRADGESRITRTPLSTPLLLAALLPAASACSEVLCYHVCRVDTSEHEKAPSNKNTSAGCH